MQHRIPNEDLHFRNKKVATEGGRHAVSSASQLVKGLRLVVLYCICICIFKDSPKGGSLLSGSPGGDGSCHKCLFVFAPSFLESFSFQVSLASTNLYPHTSHSVYIGCFQTSQRPSTVFIMSLVGIISGLNSEKFPGVRRSPSHSVLFCSSIVSTVTMIFAMEIIPEYAFNPCVLVR